MTFIIVNNEPFTIEQKITGGRGGDMLYKIASMDKQSSWFIKLSPHSILLNEIYTTFQTYDILKSESVNPVVEIVQFSKDIGDTILFFGQEYYYYMMEDLQEAGYVPLNILLCVIDMKPKIAAIFGSLLDILYIMKKDNISHCDLHTDNVFVNPDTLQIKLIDFGLGRIGNCRSSRYITKRLLDNVKQCSPNRHRFGWFDLLNASTSKFDSDFGMLITLIESYFDVSTKEVKYLRKLTKQLYRETKQFLRKDIRSRIEVLDNLYKYINEILYRVGYDELSLLKNSPLRVRRQVSK